MRNKENRFSELRLDHALKQKDVAAILGIKEDRYSKYERGIDDISLTLCNDLANYYNVSLDYLLGLSKENNTSNLRKEIDLNLLCLRMQSLRKEAKLSQSELGQKVGFPQTTYSGYEVGKRIPTTFKVYCLALFYNVSFDYLVGKSNIH